MRPAAVLERRNAEREQRLRTARAFVAGLSETLGPQAAAEFGSVARGDFNSHSDTDLLVVVAAAGSDYWGRLEALGDVPAGVEPVVWTAAEWRRQRDRGNPIAVEAERCGVWLVGNADTAST